jgi:hypothetical protein
MESSASVTGRVRRARPGGPVAGGPSDVTFTSCDSLAASCWPALTRLTRHYKIFAWCDSIREIAHTLCRLLFAKKEFGASRTCWRDANFRGFCSADAIRGRSEELKKQMHYFVWRSCTHV